MHRFATLLVLLLFAPLAHAQETLGLFVGNQGPPSSLTYIDPATGAAQQLLVGQIGVFLQGMELMNDRLYVTAPGSSSIDVINPDTRQRIAQIQDSAFGSARYIAQVGPERAYVTTQDFLPNATSSEVVILNLANNSVAGRITVPVQPEGLAVSGTRAYIALGAFGGSPSLLAIDTTTDTVIGPVEIGCSARFVLADSDGDVFAICNGTDQVVVVDGASGMVTATVNATQDLGSSFSLGQDAALIHTSAGERLVIVTATGLVYFNTDSHTFGSAVTIPEATTREISAIGYDAQRDQFILGRPNPTNPFSAAGTVTTHSATGALVRSVASGVYPAYVAVYSASPSSNEPVAAAEALTLGSVYPNPFADRATVAFTLDRSETVRVALYDALGREVAVLAHEAFAAGEHTVPFSGDALPSGVYLLRIEAGERTLTRPITRLR